MWKYQTISSVVFFDFPTAAKFRWAEELSGSVCQDELLPFWEGVWLYISRHAMAWPFVISSCNAYIDPADVTDLDIWLHMYLCLLLGYFSLESTTRCGGRKGISWEPEETVENNSQIAGNLRRIDAYVMSFKWLNVAFDIQSTAQNHLNVGSLIITTIWVGTVFQYRW